MTRFSHVAVGRAALMSQLTAPLTKNDSPSLKWHELLLEMSNHDSSQASKLAGALSGQTLLAGTALHELSAHALQQ